MSAWMKTIKLMIVTSLILKISAHFKISIYIPTSKLNKM